jgi:Icc-related predicted phosphoesterase
MKIAVCSDLHLEFGGITLENKENADVLILGGDICVAKDLNEHDDPMPTAKSQALHEFFYNCCNVFPHVIYIVGNHEHYHGDFKYTISRLKKYLKYLPNLQILDKEVWTLHDEVTFIGGTLWTDMNKEDSLTLYSIKGMMNDFRCVKNSNREVHFKDSDGKFHTRVSNFCPEDAVEDHKKMVDYIKNVLSNLSKDRKVVVVGHHAPSKASTHPRYKDEIMMNGGYSSDLSDLMLDNPQIKLWTHGHTHEDFDYMIGSTRIVCNPRGYINYEGRADNWTLKIIEV